MAKDGKKKKKKVDLKVGLRESWLLIKAHKRPLAIGFVLMIIGRIAALVLPASSKYVIDTVLIERRGELLLPIAAIAGLATLIQAATGFGLAKIVSIAAQRAIRDMRTTVQRHVIRLPVPFFDSTKSGALISRIMNDPEGIRN